MVGRVTLENMKDSMKVYGYGVHNLGRKAYGGYNHGDGNPLQEGKMLLVNSLFMLNIMSIIW